MTSEVRQPISVLGAVPPEGDSTGRHLIRGSTWMIAWRWSVRAIGFISTLILARLLTPNDFGIIAMAMVVVGLLESISLAGQSTTLIRIRYLTREHLDTAWTIQVMFGLATAPVIIIVAPICSALVGDPRVDDVMILLSLRAVFIGFTNPGTVAFRINFEFAKEFRLGVYERLGTLLITLPLAIWSRSYLALAFGMVAGSLLGVALSYMMHSYRPWFSLRRRREIWSYSAWIMVIHVASYVTSVVDNLVVGSRGGTTAMGYYSVAYGVATLPVLELVQPTWRGVFPVYASVADDAARFKQSFLDVLRVVCLLAVPLSVGCSMVAPDFVYVALGEQWLDIVPVVAWLALSAMAMIFSEAMFTVITVGHRPRNTALMMVARFIAMVPAAYIGYAYDGLDGAAIARTALMFAFLPLIYVGLRTVMVIRIDELLACLARPILGAGTMVGALMLIHPLIPDIPLLRLVIEGAAGALTFAAAVLGFWILSGRPQGPERFVWDYMGAFLSRHAARGALRGTVGGGGSDA